MNKQETTALNMAKFIRGQTLLLLEKLDALSLDGRVSGRSPDVSFLEQPS